MLNEEPILLSTHCRRKKDKLAIKVDIWGCWDRRPHGTSAFGNWELKIPFTGSHSSMIPDPKIQQIILTEDDEFLILACDDIWEVLSSQNAVNNVRQVLRRHGAPPPPPTMCNGTWERSNEA
ncbi:hypothetical protein YC2023_118854 [Brassica napus]